MPSDGVGLLTGHPEPAALAGRLRRLGALLARLLGLAGAAGALGRGPAAELHERHLQLRERLAQGDAVLAELGLDERQQGARALDRHAELGDVALVLGPG